MPHFIYTTADKWTPAGDGVTTCRYCAKPLPDIPVPYGRPTVHQAPSYCSPEHRQKAHQRRKAREHTTGREGRCFCGATTTPKPSAQQGGACCSSDCVKELRKKLNLKLSGYKKFQGCVVQVVPLKAFATALGISEHEAATRSQQAAEQGALAIYIGKNGTVTDVGKPKPTRTPTHA